jgi:Domain of unknown function (DUF5615)
VALRLAADENFDQRILNGLRRRLPEVDVVRVRDSGLSGATDVAILDWTATEGRVLVSHDVRTITRHAYDRVRSGQVMPGVFEVPARAPIGQVIEDLVLLITVSLPREWEGQVRYLPL